MSQEEAALTGKQKRHLRGLANRMEAKVVIGHSGINDNCLESLDEYLTADELVKVRIQKTAGVDRKEAAEILTQKTFSHCVQVFGNTVILYRENSENRKIKLP